MFAIGEVVWQDVVSRAERDITDARYALAQCRRDRVDVQRVIDALERLEERAVRMRQVVIASGLDVDAG